MKRYVNDCIFVMSSLVAGAIPQVMAEKAIPAGGNIQLFPRLLSPQPVGKEITWTVILPNSRNNTLQQLGSLC